MLDGSDSGEINALAITKEGENFVSGGEDKLIKVWDYDEGICYYTGVGHSGHITKVTCFNIYSSHFLQIAIAPDQKTIVSVGTEGAIFIWHTPESVLKARADKDMPTLN